MSALEDLSREELIVLAREQDARIVEQGARIAELVDRLARLEHLLSRNSSNSSMPPSRDDDVGRTPPKPRSGGSKRSRGKQPGAPGSNLAWREVPDEQRTGSRRARVSVVPTWPPAGTWAWSTATSNTRSHWSR